MVTADVDAFPMTKQIIGPLVVKSGCSIWLYRYGLTLGAGNTFMMPFIVTTRQPEDENPPK